MADHNNRLKKVLVWAIDALDLPASDSDPATLREADGEVRRLLGGMLRRERDAMPVTPPRLNPLSRGAMRSTTTSDAT